MNLAHELNKTPAALPATIPGRVVRPLGDDDDEAAHAPAPTSLAAMPQEITDAMDLDACKAEMDRAWAEFKDSAGNAIRAGCALGTAALVAKQRIGKGDWGGWLRKNFPFSEQWVRTCMRAATAYQLGLTAPRFAKEIEAATTVEKLAGLLRPIQGKPPIVAKLRLDPKRPSTSDDPQEATDVTPKRETTHAEADLARRAKALDAKEERLLALQEALDARTKALDEREALLALREAAAAPKPDTPESVATKVKAAGRALAALKAAMAPGDATPTPALDTIAAPDPAPIATQEAAPDLAAARKAAASRAGGARSAQKAKGAPTPAKTLSKAQKIALGDSEVY